MYKIIKKNIKKVMLGVAILFLAAAMIFAGNHSKSKKNYETIEQHYSQSTTGGTINYRTAARVVKIRLGGNHINSMVPDGHGGVFISGGGGKFDHLNSSGTPIAGAARTLLGGT